MKNSSSNSFRVLAIDPAIKGFGFAVLEDPEELIDWGNRATKAVGLNKNGACLKQAAMLLERYCPDVVIIEDYRHKNFRRGRRVKELLKQIAILARSRKIRVRKLSRSRVRKLFSQHKDFNKHQIALEIVKQFPELSPRVPPIRKPWMSQDMRMNIFEAIAFALVFFFSENKRK